MLYLAIPNIARPLAQLRRRAHDHRSGGRTDHRHRRAAGVGHPWRCPAGAPGRRRHRRRRRPVDQRTTRQRRRRRDHQHGCQRAGSAARRHPRARRLGARCRVRGRRRLLRRGSVEPRRVRRRGCLRRAVPRAQLVGRRPHAVHPARGTWSPGQRGGRRRQRTRGAGLVARRRRRLGARRRGTGRCPTRRPGRVRSRRAPAAVGHLLRRRHRHGALRSRRHRGSPGSDSRPGRRRRGGRRRCTAIRRRRRVRPHRQRPRPRRVPRLVGRQHPAGRHQRLARWHRDVRGRPGDRGNAVAVRASAAARDRTAAGDGSDPSTSAQDDLEGDVDRDRPRCGRGCLARSCSRVAPGLRHAGPGVAARDVPRRARHLAGGGSGGRGPGGRPGRVLRGGTSRGPDPAHRSTGRGGGSDPVHRLVPGADRCGRGRRRRRARAGRRVRERPRGTRRDPGCLRDRDPGGWPARTRARPGRGLVTRARDRSADGTGRLPRGREQQAPGCPARLRGHAAGTDDRHRRHDLVPADDARRHRREAGRGAPRCRARAGGRRARPAGRGGRRTSRLDVGRGDRIRGDQRVRRLRARSVRRSGGHARAPGRGPRSRCHRGNAPRPRSRPGRAVDVRRGQPGRPGRREGGAEAR